MHLRKSTTSTLWIPQFPSERGSAKDEGNRSPPPLSFSWSSHKEVKGEASYCLHSRRRPRMERGLIQHFEILSPITTSPKYYNLIKILLGGGFHL